MGDSWLIYGHDSNHELQHEDNIKLDVNNISYFINIHINIMSHIVKLELMTLLFSKRYT